MLVANANLVIQLNLSSVSTGTNAANTDASYFEVEFYWSLNVVFLVLGSSEVALLSAFMLA